MQAAQVSRRDLLKLSAAGVLGGSVSGWFGTLAASISIGVLPADDVPWPVHGGVDNIRYSALTQINRDNVSKLKVAWTYDAHDAFKGSEMQSNPVVVDGVLYATTPTPNSSGADITSTVSCSLFASVSLPRTFPHRIAVGGRRCFSLRISPPSSLLALGREPRAHDIADALTRPTQLK